MSDFDYLLHQRIVWFDTGKAWWMWRSRHGSHELAVKVNEDWPDETHYTVYVDGAAVFNLDGWPAIWERIRKGGRNGGDAGSGRPPQE